MLERCMKKTLIISQFYPLPENTGGCIRTMNFVRFFKKYGSVDIAYPHLSSGAKPGNAIFANEYLLGNTDYPLNFIGRLGAILKGRPYPIRAYDDNAKRLFLSILESNNYDYILVRYIVNTYNLLALPLNLKKIIILDFDDLYSDSLYESLFYRTKSPYKKMIRNINRNLLTIYEKRCLDLNVSLFCSEQDRIQEHANWKNKFVVPNTYSNKIFENTDFGNGFKNGKILLFVGMLAYEPNVRGLKWFIESVYPKFKQEHSDAKLLVVGHLGNSSGEDVKKLCRAAQGIELHSNVPDIKEYYKRSMAVVVPILSGGGTRIKILEAALANRPILSTPVGAEGLDLVDGSDLLIFNNPEEFSFKFNEILDKKRYDALTGNAKRIVTKKYSEANFENAMKAVLLKIDENGWSI
jgi:polysaccharide biosynthesis protein PslH